jgi:hypothetical protein
MYDKMRCFIMFGCTTGTPSDQLRLSIVEQPKTEMGAWQLPTCPEVCPGATPFRGSTRQIGTGQSVGRFDRKRRGVSFAPRPLLPKWKTKPKPLGCHRTPAAGRLSQIEGLLGSFPTNMHILVRSGLSLPCSIFASQTSFFLSPSRLVDACRKG